MKAWFTVPGPDGAKFELRDIPVPTAGAGQVLVAVRASGTNRGELIRGAQMRSSGPAATPTRSGSECIRRPATGACTRADLAHPGS